MTIQFGRKLSRFPIDVKEGLAQVSPAARAVSQSLMPCSSVIRHRPAVTNLLRSPRELAEVRLAPFEESVFALRCLLPSYRRA